MPSHQGVPKIKLRARFEALDRDGNGLVSLDELQQAGTNGYMQRDHSKVFRYTAASNVQCLVLTRSNFDQVTAEFHPSVREYFELERQRISKERAQQISVSDSASCGSESPRSILTRQDSATTCSSRRRQQRGMRAFVQQRWFMLVKRLYTKVKGQDTSQYWRRSFLKITGKSGMIKVSTSAPGSSHNLEAMAEGKSSNAQSAAPLAPVKATSRGAGLARSKSDTALADLDQNQGGTTDLWAGSGGGGGGGVGGGESVWGQIVGRAPAAEAVGARRHRADRAEQLSKHSSVMASLPMRPLAGQEHIVFVNPGARQITSAETHCGARNETRHLSSSAAAQLAQLHPASLGSLSKTDECGGSHRPKAREPTPALATYSTIGCRASSPLPTNQQEMQFADMIGNMQGKVLHAIMDLHKDLQQQQARAPLELSKLGICAPLPTRD